MSKELKDGMDGWSDYFASIQEQEKTWTNISQKRCREYYLNQMNPDLKTRIKKFTINALVTLIKPKNLKYRLGFNNHYYFKYSIQGSNPTKVEDKFKVFNTHNFFKACYQAWVYRLFNYVKTR